MAGMLSLQFNNNHFQFFFGKNGRSSAFQLRTGVEKVFYVQIGPKTVESVQQQKIKTPYRNTLVLCSMLSLILVATCITVS